MNGGLLGEFGTTYLLSVIAVTLQVSLTAVAVSTVISLALALALGFNDFPGKRAATAVVNTGMGFPSVVVGLGVLLLLSNQGPIGGGFALGGPGFALTFGGVELLFTTEAMVASQVVLATPVITSVSLSAIEGVDQSLRDAAFAAGAARRDVQLTVVREARYGIVTAVLAGFGRAVSEVGSVLIVGGNLAVTNGAGEQVSLTRTLTTAITLEARQGNYETGIALGVVLVALALGVNALGGVIRDRGDA
ncbi:ABC transporter permease [Halomarina halobia]|uniref:ABC transporter permease n=1 Tax=Halomarina halobia TaxID=3033386 RepID=A0ABD6A816_9EURY|nr:ABC transporter permease [Halomarina sp. PSR21]